MSAPQTATQFLNTLGVNVHVEYTDGKYANAQNVITDLAFLGEAHVRDAVLDPANQGQSSYDALASAGIKFDFFVQGNNLSTTLSLVNAFVARHPGAISLVEGPNEVNNFPITYNGQSGNAGAQAFQAALYAAVHVDGSLAGVPVANLTSWPALSGTADYANFHAYPINGAEPQGLTSAVNEEAAVEPGVPMVMTEGGYTTLLAANNFGGVDEITQAKLTLNLYCDNAKNGIATTYIYQLLDAYADPGNNNPDDHFGLFHLDNTPKQAATAIHNLTSVLSNGADAAATASTLSYTVSNLPALGSVLALTKNATTHDVLIWSEPTIWNASTLTPITVASTSVDLHLAAAANVTVFDPLASDQVIASYQATQDVIVAVTDHPLVVEVTDIAATASLRTPAPASPVNHAPALSGAAAKAMDDHATAAPFSGMVITDPDSGQAETVTVSYSATAGALTGGGFAQTAPGVYQVVATSAAAAQADLRALIFAPTSQPSGLASTVDAFQVTVSDGQASTTDSATAVTVSHATNTPVSISGFMAAQTTTDKVGLAPFSAAVVTDPDLGQTETLTVTLATPAAGTLSGGGFAATGAAGVYQVATSSAAQAQAALRAAVFQPTENLVAPGTAITEAFIVQVSDGSISARDASTTVVVSSVNDAPSLSGLHSSVTLASGGAVSLEPTLTIADPDEGAAITGVKVGVTGFVMGDELTIASPNGVHSSFDTSTGLLTLTGAASDAAYSQALQSLSFSHAGTVDAGSRTIVFAITDDGGATTTLSEAVTVASYAPASVEAPTVLPVGSTTSVSSSSTSASAAVTSSTPSVVPSVSSVVAATSPTASTTPVVLPPAAAAVASAAPVASSNAVLEGENLLRVSASDGALTDPHNPLSVTVQAATTVAAQLAAGQISTSAAQSALFHLVDGTTSVAELTYAFFTGSTPTAAGLSYLVHSSANTSDLNDPYYSGFSNQNRYINFAVALADGGAGTAGYHAAYDGLSLTDAAAKAYAAVFGATAAPDKITAILNASVADGLGGTESRAQYFAGYGGDGLNGSGTKAALIGWLLGDSIAEGVGTYQAAETHFLQDLAHGSAQFGVDLLATYGSAPALVGQASTDPHLGG